MKPPMLGVAILLAAMTLLGLLLGYCLAPAAPVTLSVKDIAEERIPPPGATFLLIAGDWQYEFERTRTPRTRRQTR